MSADGQTWVRANATGSTANTVTVTLPSTVTGVKSVRYGYDDMPSIFYGTGPAVYNGEGIPANPGNWSVTSADD